MLGLSVQADRGVETVQKIAQLQGLHQQLRITKVQYAGRDTLEARLNSHLKLSEVDYTALSSLDWDLLTTKESE
jgi:hypothetical protein